MFDDISDAFAGFGWQNAAEVALLAIALFWLLRLLSGTTAMTVVRGFSIVSVGVVVLSRVLDSVILDWVVNNALAVLVLFVLIVFQPEFRRALERLGRTGGFRSWLGVQRESYQELIPVLGESVEHLSRRHDGALIVLERATGLQDVVETGVRMDAVPTAELLEGIFYPHTPLHDGAVVLGSGRVLAASCTLPTSSSAAARAENLGMRHRAALGLTEHTDAVVIVVSEETGTISLATDGRLIRRLDRRRLESLLQAMLHHNGRHGRSRRDGAYVPSPLADDFDFDAEIAASDAAEAEPATPGATPPGASASKAVG